MLEMIWQIRNFIVLLLLLIACMVSSGHAQNECGSKGLFALPTFNVVDANGVLHQGACWDRSGNKISFPLTSGTAVPNAATFNNSGTGAASPATFNGSAAVTISYNTIGAAPTTSPFFPTPTTGAECSTIPGTIFGNVAQDGFSTTQWLDVNSVRHDTLCTWLAVTGHGVAPVTIPSGLIVAAVGTGPSTFELLQSGTAGPTRKSKMIFGDDIGGGHETDYTVAMDNASNGSEDLTFFAGNNVTNMYFTGNCPTLCSNSFVPTTGIKQFLIDDGTHAANSNPEFGLVNGHIAHGTTGSNSTDTWATVACTTGTKTVTFATAFQNATYQVILTDQTTAGGARVSSKAAGSFTITCTGASDSVDYLVLGNPY